MPQFARPDADVALGGWTNPSFSVIDEAVADDLDKTQSPSAPAAAALEVGLTNVTDPVSSTGHILRTRYQKDVAAGAQIDLIVRLVQGVTIITSNTYANIANGWVTTAYTLLAAAADAITDYNDLRVRITANQV